MQEIVSARLELEMVDKLEWLREEMRNQHTDTKPSRSEVIKTLIDDKFKDMKTLKNNLPQGGLKDANETDN